MVGILLDLDLESIPSILRVMHALQLCCVGAYFELEEPLAEFEVSKGNTGPSAIAKLEDDELRVVEKIMKYYNGVHHLLLRRAVNRFLQTGISTFHFNEADRSAAVKLAARQFNGLAIREVLFHPCDIGGRDALAAAKARFDQMTGIYWNLDPITIDSNIAATESVELFGSLDTHKEQNAIWIRCILTALYYILVHPSHIMSEQELMQDFKISEQSAKAIAMIHHRFQDKTLKPFYNIAIAGLLSCRFLESGTDLMRRTRYFLGLGSLEQILGMKPSPRSRPRDYYDVSISSNLVATIAFNESKLRDTESIADPIFMEGFRLCSKENVLYPRGVFQEPSSLCNACALEQSRIAEAKHFI